MSSAGLKRMLARVALAVALIALGGVALSQEPSPSGREPRQPEQQQPAAPQQQPIAQPPVIVHVSPPLKSEEEAAEERRERQEKAELDRRLVNLTGELAYFTAGLFAATLILCIATGTLGYFAWRQARDMKASIAVAKESAEAAKNSADTARDSMIYTQRAWVFLPTFRLDFGVDQTGRITNIRIFSQWQNNGPTPALRCENQISVRIISIPAVEKIGPQYPGGEFIRYNIAGNIGTDGADYNIGRADLEKVWKKQARLFIWASIEYSDIFPDTPRRTTKASAEVIFRRDLTDVKLAIGQITDTLADIPSFGDDNYAD